MSAVLSRNSSHRPACMRRSPASHCCQVRSDPCTRLAACACVNRAAFRLAMISAGEGVAAGPFGWLLIDQFQQQHIHSRPSVLAVLRIRPDSGDGRTRERRSRIRGTSLCLAHCLDGSRTESLCVGGFFSCQYYTLTERICQALNTHSNPDTPINQVDWVVTDFVHFAHLHDLVPSRFVHHRTNYTGSLKGVNRNEKGPFGPFVLRTFPAWPPIELGP